MMYQNKLVVVVKSQDGKVLREDGDTVYLPFSEEYSLQFKNLNSRKAVINVEIDGQDVLGGRQLIIDANQSIDLERFIDNLDSGHKFKFIQKIKEIQEFRGDKIDDGFIRVTFQYEKPYIPFNSTITWHNTNVDYAHPKDFVFGNNTLHYDSSDSNVRGLATNDVYCKSVSNTTSTLQNYTGKVESPVTADNFDSFLPVQDEGITVKGSKSSQTFKKGYIGALEDEKHVLVLRLKGITNSGQDVKEPLTVNKKLQCSSCGKIHDSSNKFCSRCGTALI